MLNSFFSPWPSFTKEESEAVSQVLLSNKVNYWTGQECRKFEKEFAAWTACEYAVAVTNGTVALDLALKSLGIGVGDEVITTSRTFLATASSIVTVGGVPVFADVDRNSGNISAVTITPCITERTRAILVVHLAGMVAEMDAIMALAGKYNLYVIEDCAQAHGAKYKGRSVGGIGNVGAWSFCQDKIMTTGGEGGMVTTNDEHLWKKMWSYKDHGKSYEAVYKREHPSGFRWLHESFGTNLRMMEVQATIGRIQLKRMRKWMASRQNNAQIIDAAAAPFSVVRKIEVPEYIVHACYKHYLFVQPDHLAAGWSRDRIVAEVVGLGVPCYQGSCSEVYLEKAFEGTGWKPERRLPNAKELGETSLMFLVHPTLTETEITKTCMVLQSVLTKAQKK